MAGYKLLNGDVVDFSELTERENAFLRHVKALSKDGADYFEIERIAVGPGSVALGGRSRVDQRIITSPLYLAARDIATRAGIEQGLILAPEHKTNRAALVPDQAMISVTQAASLIGVTRAAVHKAIKSERLKAQRIGNVLVVQLADCERFAAERKSLREATSGRQSAGGSSGGLMPPRSLAAKAAR